jgi:hypothetical protein
MSGFVTFGAAATVVVVSSPCGLVCYSAGAVTGCFSLCRGRAVGIISGPGAAITCAGGSYGTMGGLGRAGGPYFWI